MVIALVPSVRPTLRVNDPSASALAVKDAPLSAFLPMSVARACVLPLMSTAARLTTSPSFGEMIVIFGGVLSRTYRATAECADLPPDADERDGEIVDAAAQFDRDDGLWQVGGELNFAKRARRLARQCLVHADPIVGARRQRFRDRDLQVDRRLGRCTARRAARASARRRSGRARASASGAVRTLPMNPDTADPRPLAAVGKLFKPTKKTTAPSARTRAISPMRAISGLRPPRSIGRWVDIRTRSPDFAA